MDDHPRYHPQQQQQQQQPPPPQRDALLLEPSTTQIALDPIRTQFPNSLSHYHYPDYFRDGHASHHRHRSGGGCSAHSGGFLDWWVRVLYGFLQLVFVVSLSGLCYGIFYKQSMPAPHVIKELHFDYTIRHPTTALMTEVTSTTPNSHDAFRRAVAEDSYKNPYTIFIPSFQHRQPQFRDTTTTAPVLPTTIIPTATVDLWARHDGWNAFDESVLPWPDPSQQLSFLLKPGQAYFIEITLHLPESNANKNAGMFGVITDLYAHANKEEEKMTKDDDTTATTTSSKRHRDQKRQKSKSSSSSPSSSSVLLLANSRRSGRFPHQSGWIAVISKVLCIVPLLLGAWQEIRTVRILAFRQYTEHALHPLRYVTVQLVSTTTPLGQSNPQGLTNTMIEAIGGEIRIGEELSPFQEMIKTWFYTCFCVGTVAFAILFYLSFILLQWIFETWKERLKVRRGYDEEFDFDIDLDLDDNFQDVGSFDYDDDWRDVRLDNDIHRNGEENRQREEELAQGENDPCIRNTHAQTPEEEDVAAPSAEEQREYGDVQRAATIDTCSQGQERYSHILHTSRMNDIEESDDENWEDLNVVPDAKNEPTMSILQPISIDGCLGRQARSHSPNAPHLREMTDEELSQTLSRSMYSDGEYGSSDNDRHPFLFFLFGR